MMHLSIHSTSGQQLFQQAITEPITTIDVSKLPKAIYIIRVAEERGIKYGKLVKQ